MNRILFKSKQGKLRVRVEKPTKRNASFGEGIKLTWSTNGYQWQALELTPQLRQAFEDAVTDWSVKIAIKQHYTEEK